MIGELNNKNKITKEQKRSEMLILWWFKHSSNLGMDSYLSSIIGPILIPNGVLLA